MSGAVVDFIHTWSDSGRAEDSFRFRLLKVNGESVLRFCLLGRLRPPSCRSDTSGQHHMKMSFIIYKYNKTSIIVSLTTGLFFSTIAINSQHLL